MKLQVILRKRVSKVLRMFALNFRKIMAVVTVSSFMLTSVCGTAISSLVQIKTTALKCEQELSDFVIPSSVGRITDGRYYGTDKVVVNIQDLHCHPEVQKNISRILSLLDDKYGLSKVYLEGVSGEVNTSWLDSIQDKKLRQGVIDLLLKKRRTDRRGILFCHFKKGRQYPWPGKPSAL